jgi:8-oxo-dGTP pyrophosphatase MutT (NUDIX family)
MQPRDRSFYSFAGIMTGSTIKYLSFKDKLVQALTDPLPGVVSQMKMVPAIRQKEMEKRSWDNSARKAAVLICFYPDGEEDIHLALIRRNDYDGVHSGQISFPGGKYEEDDRDLTHTALREAEEETNILMKSVDVLGEITSVYIPPSNFIVSPVVGCTPKKPDFIAEKSEVQEILSISIKDLLDPANRQVKDIPHREYNIIDVPCFYIQGHIIWGATAMILSEMLDVIQRC